MIRLADATVLALTKLRARRIRTTVTTLLASLLFGVLIAGSVVVSGALLSVDRFSEDGLTSRYIVSVNNAVVNSVSTSPLRDEDTISKAKDEYKELVENKTTTAERLGLPYSQAADQPPYMQSSDGQERLYPSDRNGIVKRLLAEKYGAEPYMDDAKLEVIAKQYGASKLFVVENFNIKQGASLNVLPNGKEIFYDTSDDEELNKNYTQPIIESAFPIAPPDLTTSFMLPNNGGWTADSGALPLIVPQDTAERLLGLEGLAATASAEQKLARIKEVRDKAGDLTVSACYRNSASIDLVQQTIMQQKEIKASESNKDYEKPALIYALPDATTCENPTVVDDTRTDEEKERDGNQAIFDKEFGLYTEPESYFVDFKIVGISPVAANAEQQNRNLEDIVSSLLRTSGVGQLIPKNLYDQIEDKGKYDDILTYEPYYLIGNEDNKTRYVEFENASDAQRFIDEQSCTTQYDGTCKPAGRDYMATLSFSNSVALSDMRARASEWLGVALVAVTILAATIMWITIGRTIADGRHETAIFRAIGFSRVDISLVYIIYTIILSVLTTLLSMSIGVLGAYIIDKAYSPWFTAQAQYAFGGLDVSKEFSLLGFNTDQLGIILAACLLTGLLSMIIPLIRNVSRNPIRDMRDDG